MKVSGRVRHRRHQALNQSQRTLKAPPSVTNAALVSGSGSKPSTTTRRFQCYVGCVLLLVLTIFIWTPQAVTPIRTTKHSSTTTATAAASTSGTKIQEAIAAAASSRVRAKSPSTRMVEVELEIDNKLSFLDDLRKKYAHQPTFLQAVEEMASSLLPLFQDETMGDFYLQAFLMMAEPERTISFRVPWVDDKGKMQYNRGWRVEFSSVLGPYKGGLRFHPTVDEGVLKFLGFEQIFKNALTGLPMGGGKGGSDFDPKGKSENEIRNFCNSFMTELYRYLHPSTDVPAGDIGVGGREIGYMYGQYKRLTNKHGEGILTGKSINFSGSQLRPEATGYGLVYVSKIAMEKKYNGQSLEGMRCAVSGSGNVAQYAVEKLIEFGAKVITMSDSNGVLIFEDGITQEDLRLIMECKNLHRQRLHTLVDKISGGRARYIPDKSPWTIIIDDNNIQYDIAFPCATQNEIDIDSAKALVNNAGVKGVFEGANLPTTIAGQNVLRDHQILYIPGKASNAGGVGVSGLEMSQNAQKLQWDKQTVDEKLQSMMSNIYRQMEQQLIDGTTTLEQGANRAGFIKVANAMKELGWIF